jgi:hypothetical protein
MMGPQLEVSFRINKQPERIIDSGSLDLEAAPQ